MEVKVISLPLSYYYNMFTCMNSTSTTQMISILKCSTLFFKWQYYANNIDRQLLVKSRDF